MTSKQIKHTNTVISSDNSTLPALSELSKLFNQDTVKSLQDSFLQKPSVELKTALLSIMARISKIVPAMYFAGKNNSTSVRKTILDEVLLLMHEIAAVKEYLADLCYKLFTKKVAVKLSEKMENEVNWFFKCPANQIKHKQFKLAWLSAQKGEKLVQGFYVNGTVKGEIKGPASLRFGESALSEAYSLNIFLRKAVEVFFSISNLVGDEVIKNQQLLSVRVTNEPTEDFFKEDIQKSLTLLSTLQKIGFPNEKGIIGFDFDIIDNKLVISEKLQFDYMAKYPDEVQVEFGGIEGGDSVLLPKWAVSPQGATARFSVHKKVK